MLITNSNLKYTYITKLILIKIKIIIYKHVISNNNNNLSTKFYINFSTHLQINLLF